MDIKGNLFSRSATSTVTSSVSEVSPGTGIIWLSGLLVPFPLQKRFLSLSLSLSNEGQCIDNWTSGFLRKSVVEGTGVKVVSV